MPTPESAFNPTQFIRISALALWAIPGGEDVEYDLEWSSIAKDGKWQYGKLEMPRICFGFKADHH